MSVPFLSQRTRFRCRFTHSVTVEPTTAAFSERETVVTASIVGSTVITFDEPRAEDAQPATPINKAAVRHFKVRKDPETRQSGQI